MFTRATWRRFAWLGTILVVAACYVPAPEVPGPDLPQADKLLHVVAFLGIGLAWRLAGLTARRVLLVGVMLILVTELGQAVLPTGRSADVFDGLADALGLGLGLLLAGWTHRWAVRPAEAADRAA